MRRVFRFPVIVAVGVGVLMLGALLGSGTWANVFLTEPGELACLSVTTPTGKTASCSTVEETTLLQRLTKNYTYYAPGHRDSTGMSVAGSTTSFRSPARGASPNPLYTTLRSRVTGGRLMWSVHVQCTVTSPVRVGTAMRGRSRSCRDPTTIGSTSLFTRSNT